MRAATEWLERYQKFWSERLDRLAAFLEEDTWPPRRVKPSLTIKRHFNAPPEKVFAAWTDPEKVKRWMGPGEVKVLATEGDSRKGGRYGWLMQAPDGEHHDVSGVYREFVPKRNWCSPGAGNRRPSASRW